MTAAPSAIQTVEALEDPRQLALLRAVGLDKLNADQRELAINIAGRYNLDLLLKHLVMIEGRPYITRDGLLHVAHNSGQFDGIETTEPVLADGFWRSTCSVYRKDMSHPFTYTGRYPEKGQNAKFGPEMAVKVGEVMSLRRAFDVAAPVAEERWDVETASVEPPPPPPTLAERVAEKAAEVAPSYTVQGAEAGEILAEPMPVETSAITGLTEKDVDDIVAAEAIRIFDEGDIAPAGGLSVDELKLLAKEHHVLAAVLATYVKSLFGKPMQLADLTDAQRQELWDAVKP